MKAIQCYAYRIIHHTGGPDRDRNGEPYAYAVYGSSWQWLDLDFVLQSGGGDKAPMFERVSTPPGVSIEDVGCGWTVSRGKGL